MSLIAKIWKHSNVVRAVIALVVAVIAAVLEHRGA